MRTYKPLTKQLLKRFIQERKESGFTSNLQFQIDASAVGLNLADIGDAHQIKAVIQENAGEVGLGWWWDTPVGKLVEFGRHLHLEGDPALEEILELLEKDGIKLERESSGLSQ